MAKIQLVLVMLCIIVVNTTSCEKDKSNVLPDETQEGYNTLGFLLNGKVWTSKTPYCATIASANKSNLTIGAGIGQTLIPGFSLVIRNSEIKTNISYPLTYLPISNGAEYAFKDNTGHICQYYSNEEYKGSLILTKFDTINKILSGRFSFKAKLEKSQPNDCECDSSILDITEGRFDLKYTKE